MSETKSPMALNPWHPMTDPVDLKHLGKLSEEMGEATAAISRCVIQGVDECEPVTKKPNKQWLEDELADVMAGIELAHERFDLDWNRMMVRKARKKEHLRAWHAMAGDDEARS